MSAPAGSQSRILLGLLLGGLAGTIVNAMFVTPAGLPGWLTTLNSNVAEPIGQIFLRLLFVTVVPLVFASLAVGVAQIGSLGAVGRVGTKTLAYFLGITTVAVIIGLSLVNTIRPGDGLPDETKLEMSRRFGGDAAKKAPADYTIMTFVQSMFPRNPIKAAVDLEMLGIITFALLVGVGTTTLEPHKRQLVMTGLEAVGELMVFIIRLAMTIAPFGVFCLIFSTTSQFGLDLLKLLGAYVVTVVVGLAIMGGVVLPVLVRLFTGRGPIDFFRNARTSMITAFSTSSSNATLPTNIRTAVDRFGVPPAIAGFVLPLGATMCMSGTALFEGVTVMFLAQAQGVVLSLGQQVLCVALCVLTAVGAAGVPGGSIPLLMTVLATFGIPAESIAIILGVDRFLDMCRTTVNNIGDLSAVLTVSHWEAANVSATSPASSAGEPHSG